VVVRAEFSLRLGKVAGLVKLSGDKALETSVDVKVKSHTGRLEPLPWMLPEDPRFSL
jgi:hypothetical protein